MQPQYVGQKYVNKGLHLWDRRADGNFQCVLCGGIARVPTVNDVCDRYERVSAEDKAKAPK